MSEAMSSALRFEDHFGPIVPEVSAPARPSASIASLSAEPAGRLTELARHMRLSVVQATMTTDPAQKIVLWESYRTARREALALLPPAPEGTAPPRLHSV
jgi:hypothetical protein